MANVAAAAASMLSSEQERILQQELSECSDLAVQVITLGKEAEHSRSECSDLADQTARLYQLLGSIDLLSFSTQPMIYKRPIHRILSDVSKNLEKGLTLVKKCKKHSSGVLRQVFAITTTADFRKVQALLESSIADMEWLLSIESGVANLALPPIASIDPILAWVWSYIAAIQLGQPNDRVDAANELATLARDSERNKKMIIDEDGIQPLLRLLKEGTLPDAQIAAANALFNIGTDQERVQAIVQGHGIPSIVHVLADSTTSVQVAVANLVGRMAELDDAAREEFARENVIRPLMMLLSVDTTLDDPKAIQPGKACFHSLVQINKELGVKPRSLNNSLNLSASSSSHSDGSSRGGHHHMKREVDTPEMRLKLKISCASALRKLSKGSVANSRKITETKWLLCLATIITTGRGDLLLNCLNTVMEVTAVAESDADLRHASFKTNNPAAKAILEQLLRILEEETNCDLLVPAIKSVGYLARTFPARETRIIKLLVIQLEHIQADVAREATIALEKFACPENFNHLEHSKTIVELNGIQRLTGLLKAEDVQLHGFKLLCYLAPVIGNSRCPDRVQVQVQVQALNFLHTSDRRVMSQYPELREIFGKAIHQLTHGQPRTH